LINVYNKDYKRIGFIESYSYLSWVRRYSTVGEFELKCAPENLNLLSLGNLISKAGDNEAAFIETLLVESVEKELITVRGRFLPSVLDRRIIWNTELLNGDISSSIGQLMTNHLIAPQDTKRLIEKISFESEVLNKEIFMQISYKNLLEVVTAITSESATGLKGCLGFDGIILSLYEGIEQPYVFSKEFENLLSQNYTESIKDSANLAKIAGEGEGEERKTVVLGDEAGLNRREIYVDARDLSLNDYSSEKDYEDALLLRGQEKLFDLRKRESFDAVANTNGNLRYRTDYDLGDVVTAKSKLLGISKRLRITEIIETYDENGMHVDLTFGDPLPTLGEKLKGVI
jgi:hypothetical protein